MEAHGEGHMAPREGVTGKLLIINLYISWYEKKKKNHTHKIKIIRNIREKKNIHNHDKIYYHSSQAILSSAEKIRIGASWMMSLIN